MPPTSFAGLRTVTAAFLATLLLASGPSAAAQEGAAGQGTAEALRVFIDCETWPCDTRYFRTEITFVNWVRIREEADVHVILTGQRTGGGGREFVLDFIGLDGLEGTDDQLTHSASRTDTEDERLAGVTRTLAIGLARFAALAGRTETVRVEAAESTPVEAGEMSPPGRQGEVDDPWDYWVFSAGLNGSIRGEERQSSRRLGGRLSADRTTEVWKLSADVFGNWSRQEFELNDSTTFVNSSRSWLARTRIVYGMADLWSLAVQGGASASTFVNQDLSAQIGAGVEYSLLPYAEATRRRVTASYLLFLRYNDYEEETIFGELSETLPQHAVELALDFRQPWGEAGVGIEASQYLHDTSKNRLSLDGDLEFRVYRGLSLDFDGRISWIRDQIFLPKEGASDEEILTRRRQLATNFDYRFSTGFSLSFGSIYNNVVNNRFRGGFF